MGLKGASGFRMGSGTGGKPADSHGAAQGLAPTGGIFDNMTWGKALKNIAVVAAVAVVAVVGVWAASSALGWAAGVVGLDAAVPVMESISTTIAGWGTAIFGTISKTTAMLAATVAGGTMVAMDASHATIDPHAIAQTHQAVHGAGAAHHVAELANHMAADHTAEHLATKHTAASTTSAPWADRVGGSLRGELASHADAARAGALSRDIGPRHELRTAQLLAEINAANTGIDGGFRK